MIKIINRGDRMDKKYYIEGYDSNNIQKIDSTKDIDNTIKPTFKMVL